MSDPSWQKIKDIFADAMELPSAEREEFVRSQTDDDAIYQEVISLLAASDETEPILEKHGLGLAERAAEQPPDYRERIFGNYRIIREIGTGGMGSVFLAERSDGAFAMQVALKIVRQSVADSELIERFRQERQILASLHHPNIAALLDGGLSEKGEPFLAMEYVEGRTLTEHCSELSTEEKLRIFLKVCAAVSYAHRNLVVHRDLKPGNILVTPDGEPKLLDFGLAKVFEGDGTAEQTRLRAFTPAYASPEQILGGRISTASDQYSLGVILYELLTGQKPFDLEGRSLDEIVRSLESGEAMSPSAAVQKTHGMVTPLPGDLDNITLKALRREPERRYTSVEALADDVERYLDGRPVTARPNTFGYLASRFVSRHKTPVIAAAVVLIAVIAGLTASLWQAAIARAERDRAEQRFQEVRRLSTSFLFEIAPRIERLEGSTETRQILVTRALEYLNNLADEKSNDAELQLELAQAYQKIGDLQGNPAKPNLGDYIGAVSSFERARSIIANLPDSYENRLRLAGISNAVAKIHFAQRQMKLSLEEAERASAIYKDLLAEQPDSIELKRAFLANQVDHAYTYAINNQYEIAVPMLRETLDRLSELDQSDREIARLSALATGYLSNSLSWDNKQAEAEAVNEKAVVRAADIAARYPRDPEVQKAVYEVYTLASSTFESIKNDVSLAWAEKALAVAQTASAIDPADEQGRFILAKARSRVGITLGLNKRTAEALAALSEAERSLTQLIEREPRNTIYLDDLSAMYIRLGDVEKTRDLNATLAAYQKAAEVCERLVALDEKNLVARRDLAQALKSVGVTQEKLGLNDNARQSLGRAVEIVAQLRTAGAIGKWDDKIFTEMEARYAALNAPK